MVAPDGGVDLLSNQLRPVCPSTSRDPFGTPERTRPRQHPVPILLVLYGYALGFEESADEPVMESDMLQAATAVGLNWKSSYGFFNVISLLLIVQLAIVFLWLTWFEMLAPPCRNSWQRFRCRRIFKVRVVQIRDAALAMA